MSLEHLSVWGKSQCQYVSDKFFGGSFLWWGSVDGCGLWKDSVTSPRCCSWLDRQVSQPFPWKGKCRSSPCTVSYIISFILSDRLPQSHKKEILSITNMWGGKALQMVNWYHCFPCLCFSFEQILQALIQEYSTIIVINGQSWKIQGWFHLRGPLSVHNHTCNCERNLTEISKQF